MNKINFARNTPTSRPAHAKKPIRWILIVCALIILGMLTLQTIQWNALHKTKTNRLCIEQGLSPLDRVSCEKKNFNDELPVLEKTACIIEKAQPDQDPFLSLYHTVCSLIGTGSLEALSCAGKKVELSLALASVKAAQSFIDKLADLPVVSSVNLGAIRKGPGGLIFSIEAQLA